MSSLIDHFGDSLRDLPHFKLSSTNLDRIKTLCVEILDMRDYGQLSDRFEGRAFFENKAKEVGGYFTCLEKIGKPKPIINRDLLESKLRIFNHTEQKYVILVTSYSLPKLEVKEYKVPRVVILQKGLDIYCFAGILGVEDLNDRDNFRNFEDGKAEFKGLNKLSMNFK